MKKLLFSCLLFTALVLTASAQPRAIGARLGYGFDASYQHSMGSSNMIEIELGMPAFHGVEVAATYDWIFPIQGNWNWYAGVGAAAGLYGFGPVGGFFGIAGRVGVEYTFNFPLQLSFDYRPVVGPYFGAHSAGFYASGLYGGAFALAARYKF